MTHPIIAASLAAGLAAGFALAAPGSGSAAASSPTTAASTAPAAASVSTTAEPTPSTLIEVTPEVVQIDVPAPGAAQRWSMSVTNLTDEPVPLGLEVLGDASLPLFTGPTPLTVVLSDAQGEVVSALPAAELVGQTQELPDLAARTSYTLTGEVALPTAADNRYAEQDGALRFRYTALGSEGGPPGPPWLSLTGSGPSILGWLALALGAAGILTTLAARSLSRRRKAQWQ